jgi:hypothetical protein
MPAGLHSERRSLRRKPVKLNYIPIKESNSHREEDLSPSKAIVIILDGVPGVNDSGHVQISSVSQSLRW